MKKGIALILAMLLCTTFAMAAEWESGTSPNQPYAGVPEVDLDEKIGYMFLYPNESMSMVGGGRTLYIYMPREDVEAGDGMFYLLTNEGEVWRTNFNGNSVKQREMTEYELTTLQWGGGTCFEITVAKSLELGKAYYVNMAEGCVKVKDSDLQNLSMGSKTAWTFEVTGDYGVNLMEYRRPLATKDEYENEVVEPQAGDEVRFDVVLEGEAATAILYANNGSVSFDSLTIEESGEVVGKVNGAEPSWGVLFLNADEEPIMQIEF